MKLTLKNGYEIEISSDFGIGDLVTEITDSSVIGTIAANLTDENLEEVTLGESGYTNLHCESISTSAVSGGYNVHIHLKAKTEDAAAKEILEILVGGEE